MLDSYWAQESCSLLGQGMAPAVTGLGWKYHSTFSRWQSLTHSWSTYSLVQRSHYILILLIFHGFGQRPMGRRYARIDLPALAREQSIDPGAGRKENPQPAWKQSWFLGWQATAAQTAGIPGRLSLPHSEAATTTKSCFLSWVWALWAKVTLLCV